MKLDRCNPCKYYLYHRDHGHDIEECIELQDEIKELIHCGRLDRFFGIVGRSAILQKLHCTYQNHHQGRRNQLIILPWAKSTPLLASQ